MKGCELRLHIDESVKPIVQHVPFRLRENRDVKLDELLQLDIPEEVPEGPSGWISLLVVVPKSDGDVRVCPMHVCQIRFSVLLRTDSGPQNLKHIYVRMVLSTGRRHRCALRRMEGWNAKVVRYLNVSRLHI